MPPEPNSPCSTVQLSSRQWANPELNQLQQADRAAHQWYRFVLSYPPHLVQQYVNKFGLGQGDRVLDPFCGTGTTVVECKKLGLTSVGIEANPMAHFAGTVKLDWTPDPDRVQAIAATIATTAQQQIAQSLQSGEPWRDLTADQRKVILANSISDLPLHKTLILLEQIHQAGHGDGNPYPHLRLALAKAVITQISNLHFGPEVGVGKAKVDAPAVEAWLAEVDAIATDLSYLQTLPPAPAQVYHGDARQILAMGTNGIAPQSISAVITSPPYPNEKDYTRTTRLESVLLGFINNKAELRSLKHGLIRSNTRNVYKADTDDLWVEKHAEIQAIAQAIEARRIELGKTSGFERLYHRAVKLYFGGMAKHLADLRHVLCPGAQLAYVVGDQKSYLQVMIRTGELLAQLAQGLGYQVVDIELFRTRLATATKEQMREEVVLLRWPGQWPTADYPFSDRPF